MLDTMMKVGGHRVVILNDGREKKEYGLGIYIRGNGCITPYCRDAKNQLYQNLVSVRKSGLEQSVFGIYLDVDDLTNFERPAYVAMKEDIRAGRFRTIVVSRPEVIFDQHGASDDFLLLSGEVQHVAILLGRGDGLSPLAFDKNVTRSEK
jgi:hypothetical protein